LITRIKNEYKEPKGKEVYKAIIPDGPPPIPKN